MRAGPRTFSIGLAAIFFLIALSPVSAEKWSRRYIEALPDSAFAVIETTHEGKKVRHLPHHNDKGEIDLPHLQSALGRIHQAKWIDPANFAVAKGHLEQHLKGLKQTPASQNAHKFQD